VLNIMEERMGFKEWLEAHRAAPGELPTKPEVGSVRVVKTLNKLLEDHGWHG
jgi:hypothetical protein